MNITFLTGPGENISDSYSYKLTFNTSGLQKQPTSIWLHLNTVPSDHLAVINITIGQEVFVWRQPTMDDDENQTEVQINLGSLLTWTASTLTVKVTSTIHIKTDHFGLLLYMGETPEAVNDLLIKPPGKTKIINDQDKRLKKDIENINYEVPCQRKSLIVPLNQLGGSFENIVAPVTADIGQCVGECPVTNQTLRTELLDLLAPGDLDLEEGSAHENTLLKVGCVATSLLPLTVLRIDQNGLPIVEPLKNLIIDSCGCFQCSP